MPEMDTAGIGLGGIAAILPPNRSHLDSLHANGLLISKPADLVALGFSHAHLADATHDAAWLAATAASAALNDAGLSAIDIDALIWASALPANHVVSGNHPSSFLAAFNSPASQLQDSLGMDRAIVHGIAQQGCGGMFAALRSARALLVAEPQLQHVLCVGVDILPVGSPREILYNVISDAAAAVVVSRSGARLRWIDCHQVSKGYYWDVPARQKEIIASYFPTSRLVITELLARNQLSGSGLAHVVPNGIGAGSWEILCQLCGIPIDRIRKPAGEFGHTIAADNILHLAALSKTQALHTGDKLLLFTYGFGSSWCGILLEQIS
ncbi:3-oxoacyl-[acyl-carrier-protein] synthase III C-terminal domain-containing protein [Rariglobus hedericola]|uniref:Beta-ketoacyl-[acyl-carrier-protein] synthase III C-terminal domain-containing protein n=1 Tax=Rariglobus hedericola TaxID=2597822 RepID=A0A556QQD5_9BACT|nr:3-oxoacyl-[acyl-carrier-protein] synthase III C-terminal domain-containing protein [Rariglobus hedericola]TSJ78844.1 hypothetical protein FPL22_05930 [Rariglobus hedericola]